MSDDNSQNETGGQSGIDQETERRNRENETGQQNDPLTSDTKQTDQAGQAGQKPDEAAEGETGTGFVGSTGDQSSDYLTKGENQEFAPEGQGASDTNAGTSDIETGQSGNIDSTLDDGSDTSR